MIVEGFPSWKLCKAFAIQSTITSGGVSSLHDVIIRP